LDPGDLHRGLGLEAGTGHLPWCGRGKDDGNILENHGKVLENHGKYHFLMEFFQKQWGNISENIGKSWEV